VDPLSVKRDGRSVLNELGGEASTLESVGDVERTILALHACGVQARTLGDLHLETKLLAARRADGSFADQVNLTAFAVFALRAEGRSSADRIVQAAGRWIAAEQDSDGGFGFATRGSGSEVDDTAAAVEAIVAAAGHERGVIGRALAYITRAQNPDGGFPEGPGGQSNAQSTAWAVQGLVSAGRNVDALRRGGSRSPLGYLRSLVAPDGSVRYSRTNAQTPVWVTAQALTALARKAFPIAPVRSRAGASPSGSAVARATASAGSLAAARSRSTPGSPSAPVRAAASLGRPQAEGASDAYALTAVSDDLARSLTSVARRALGTIGVAAVREARAG
jgi:hypothetical protein